MSALIKRTLVCQDCPTGSSCRARQVEIVTDLSARCECSYDELSPEEQWLWDEAVALWHESDVRAASLPAELRALVAEDVARMKVSQFMPFLKDLEQVETEGIWYRDELEILIQDAEAELRLRALECGDDDAVGSLTPEALSELLRSPNARERSIAIRLVGRVLGADSVDGGPVYARQRRYRWRATGEKRRSPRRMRPKALMVHTLPLR